MQYRRPWQPLALLAAALAVLVVGCSDSPFNLDWDRTYPEGLIIREDGVVRITVDDDGKVAGALEVRTGGQTGKLDVVFLNEKGAAIVPADDEYLEVTLAFSDLATFEQGTPGEFSGRLRGVKAGRTDVIFKYKQGSVGSGKGIWNSPAIELTIAP